jgi:glycosyltransferase involved in cell wall biosynthesis
MVNLACSLVERGHRVDLVLGVREGAFFNEIHPDVKLVILGRRSAYAALPLLLRRPASAWRMFPALMPPNPHWVLGCIPALRDYLKRERPDALLSALNYSNLAAIWAHRLAGVDTRLVVSERNTLSRRAGVGRRNRRLPGLISHYYPWADGIAAVSDGVAEDLAATTGLPRERITTTYNPVVTPGLAERAAQAVDHRWFGQDSAPVILAAGKLREQKGFDTLISAFAMLRKQRDARLLILGSGELQAVLEEQARAAGIDRDVEFCGFVENPFCYMAAASVFVLSSRWEGLPGVLIQAMACGCPVVSTDCQSGPREILDEDVGRLIPVDDPSAMADAMAHALDAPRNSERLVERAQDFSVERSTALYLDVLSGS